MPRSVIYAIAAVVAVLAIGGYFVYGTGADGVHEALNPPAVLDKLRLSEPAPRVARGPRGPREPGQQRQQRQQRQGQGRIQAAWTDAAGNRVRLADLRGRMVVLNLWATWCAPCITELPALARAKAALARDNIVVVAVDLEKKEAAEVAAFLKAHNADGLGVAIDRELALMRAFAAYGLPLTIVFDKRGREFARAFGPQKWDDPEAVAYLRQVANAAPERRGQRGDRAGRGLFRVFRSLFHGH